MISRREQVRRDAEAVLYKRVENLKAIANGQLFISGGTGFLGTWLLELISILNAKHDFNLRVTVLSRNASEFAKRFGHLGSRSEFAFVDGDIRHLTEVPREIDFIIHAAALTDRRLFASNPTAVGEINALGTIRLLRAAGLLEELKKILLISSGLVYGPQPLDMERVSEDFVNGIPCDSANSIYAESKRFAEAMATSFVSEAKLPLVTIRPFGFFGPHQSLELPWAVNEFTRDSLAGRSIKIMGDGSTVRSLMYASDYAYWTLAALSRGHSRQAYNVGSPEPVDLLSLARMITQHFTPPPDIETRVGQFGHEPTRLVPNVAKARKDLGVEVTVPLNEALHKTITWHKTPE